MNLNASLKLYIHILLRYVSYEFPTMVFSIEVACDFIEFAGLSLGGMPYDQS